MQENEVPAPRDLLKACTVLFGTDVNASAHFLKYLQAPGLKAAYRKKAFESHPDRAMVLDEPELSLEERFKEVKLAYEQLSAFIKNPWKYYLNDHTHRGGAQAGSIRKKQSTHGMRTHRKPGNNDYKSGFRYIGDHFWRGDLPKTKLLLGRFLYYSGVISMGSLVEAILWQKKQRPMVGSIAIRWNLLAGNDIRSILAGRKPGEKFCECALRCGYIKPHQLNLLLWRQRMLQPRIGSFFVNREILSLGEIEHFVAQMRRHNRKY